MNQTLKSRTLWTALLGLCFLCEVSIAQGAIEFKSIVTADNVSIQVCLRRPDPVRFPGPRPALMVVMGSSIYDSCASLERSIVNQVVDSGILVFARQKRGITRDLSTGQLSVELPLYVTADFPLLKSDTLSVFDNVLSDSQVDAGRIAIMGGSEGTVISTYIANQRRIQHVFLLSSMVEGYSSLFERQYYQILPYALVQAFGVSHPGSISPSELSDSELAVHGMRSFKQIDLNSDGVLSASELETEIRRCVQTSVATGDNTFFLSNWGGMVSSRWHKSAFNEALGPEILKLNVGVQIHHGLADQNTLVGPVKELERQVMATGLSNIQFHYYPGLEHALDESTLNQILSQVVEKLQH